MILASLLYRECSIYKYRRGANKSLALTHFFQITLKNKSCKESLELKEDDVFCGNSVKRMIRIQRRTLCVNSTDIIYHLPVTSHFVIYLMPLFMVHIFI